MFPKCCLKMKDVHKFTAEWAQMEDKICPFQKSQRFIKSTGQSRVYPPHLSMTAWHRHGVDQYGDTLLWGGISLNLQTMGQVSPGCCWRWCGDMQITSASPKGMGLTSGELAGHTIRSMTLPARKAEAISPSLWSALMSSLYTNGLQQVMQHLDAA